MSDGIIVEVVDLKGSTIDICLPAQWNTQQTDNQLIEGWTYTIGRRWLTEYDVIPIPLFTEWF